MASFEIKAMVRDIIFIKTCGVLLLMKSFRASEKMATVSIPSLWLCNGDIEIGHVPRFHPFVRYNIRRSGEIHCHVTGSRLSADLEQGGLGLNFRSLNFRSLNFRMLTWHTNYTKISTIRKFPAIRYLVVHEFSS